MFLILDADPDLDLAFRCEADPDLTFHCDADPDQTFNFNATLQPLAYRPSISQGGASEARFLVQGIPVLRIRDVYPGSRILIFTHPGSRIPDLGSRISDPGSRIQKQQQKREVKKN